ncbi:hypothetical protein AURDEDRAFT_163592 [Auricularia subglabra TFB-10046 SS5]|nr:hypothetical protein AURDEDRAFT_163592 [Auricularia subglabra TFB-10046 SS5]
MVHPQPACELQRAARDNAPDNSPETDPTGAYNAATTAPPYDAAGALPAGHAHADESHAPSNSKDAVPPCQPSLSRDDNNQRRAAELVMALGFQTLSPPSPLEERIAAARAAACITAFRLALQRTAEEVHDEDKWADHAFEYPPPPSPLPQLISAFNDDDDMREGQPAGNDRGGSDGRIA